MYKYILWKYFNHYLNMLVTRCIKFISWCLEGTLSQFSGPRLGLWLNNTCDNISSKHQLLWHYHLNSTGLEPLTFAMSAWYMFCDVIISMVLKNVYSNDANWCGSFNKIYFCNVIWVDSTNHSTDWWVHFLLLLPNCTSCFALMGTLAMAASPPIMPSSTSMGPPVLFILISMTLLR